ncbi:MAG: SCO family protein [Verrucomicrobia bacterium]|nr:MAG: SCO family protein [Verrucomicrobiota bacterium]
MKPVFRIALPVLVAVGLAVLWKLGRPLSSPRAARPLSEVALGQVQSFVLTNQLGRRWSSDQLQGRVWVADVFFTRCPGPCVNLARTLQRLQAALPLESRAMIVSLTADAAYDTPEVLARYAVRWGADSNRWVFLTGPQATIYRLATGQLRLAVGENPHPETASPAELFIHSTRLALVDHRGRVRAFFDGEDPGSVPRLVRAIRELEAPAPRPAASP